MARPPGSQNKDKPFRDALRMEAFSEQIGAPLGVRSLRAVARALLDRGATGDVGAAKEIADRLDGKVAQAIVGDDEHDAIRVRGIGWLENVAGETNEGENSKTESAYTEQNPRSGEGTGKTE